MPPVVPPVRDPDRSAVWSKPSRFFAKVGDANIGFDGPALLVLGLATILGIVGIVYFTTR